MSRCLLILASVITSTLRASSVNAVARLCGRLNPQRLEPAGKVQFHGERAGVAIFREVLGHGERAVPDLLLDFSGQAVRVLDVRASGRERAPVQFYGAAVLLSVKREGEPDGFFPDFDPCPCSAHWAYPLMLMRM